MGSYLTVVNDTPVEWRCRVGTDQEVLKMVTMVMSIITCIAMLCGTFLAMSLASPIVVAMGAPILVSVGAGSTIMISLHALPAPIPILPNLHQTLTNVRYTGKTISMSGTLSSFGTTISKGIYDELEEKGFKLIVPNDRHRYGKMALSLWRQSACVRVELRDASTAVFHTLYMRPIFSGATADSNKDYSIQQWLDKKGTEEIPIKAKLAEAVK